MYILKTLILIGILPLVIFLVQQSAKSFFNEKSKNLATRQDIEDITKKVEQVKTDYINQSYAWKKFFDFELENIKNVWNACWELQSSARSLRPILDELPMDKEKEKELFWERYREYIKKKNSYIDMVIKNQPFIPPEIYSLSAEVKKLAITLEVDFKICLQYDQNPKWDTILETNKKLDLIIDDLNEQIRNYIYIKLDPKK